LKVFVAARRPAQPDSVVSALSVWRQLRSSPVGEPGRFDELRAPFVHRLCAAGWQGTTAETMPLPHWACCSRAPRAAVDRTAQYDAGLHRLNGRTIDA
jgi:hypothetical protein